MNAHLFDSDLDYFNSMLSPAELLAQNIMDGSASEGVLEKFDKFLAEKYGGEYDEAVEFAGSYLEELEDYV